MSARFSKRAVLTRIEAQCAIYDDAFQAATGRRIDPDNGWAQCGGTGVQGSGIYGQWRSLRDLAAAIWAGEVAE